MKQGEIFKRVRTKALAKKLADEGFGELPLDFNDSASISSFSSLASSGTSTPLLSSRSSPTTRNGAPRRSLTSSGNNSRKKDSVSELIQQKPLHEKLEQLRFDQEEQETSSKNTKESLVENDVKFFNSENNNNNNSDRPLTSMKSERSWLLLDVRVEREEYEKCRIKEGSGASVHISLLLLSYSQFYTESEYLSINPNKIAVHYPSTMLSRAANEFTNEIFAFVSANRSFSSISIQSNS